MMNPKTIGTVLVGTALVGGGSLLPIIPSQMTFIGAYERPHETTIALNASSTDGTVYHDAGAFFEDKNGNVVELPITTDRFESMKGKEGQLENPSKTEFVSFYSTLVAPPAKADIAFSDAENNIGLSVSSLITSITAATPDGLVAGCGTHVTTAGLSFTAATYNGNAMTLVTSATASGNTASSCYYIVGPSSGAHNLSMTLSGTAAAFYIAGSAYSGMGQTGQPDASHTRSSVTCSTSYSDSVTTIADNAWTILYMWNGSGGVSAASNATLRTQTSGGQQSIFDSNGPVTPAGSYTMGLNTTSGGFCLDIMMSFSPVATPPASTPTSAKVLWTGGKTIIPRGKVIIP
jgi:hypothetical protein